MKNPVTRGLAVIAIPSLFLIGCYTQFAVQDEPRDDYSSRDQDRYAYTDTTDTDEGNDYDGARRRFYYDYYPTVAIGFGLGSWYLDPWYYDPWYYGAWPGPYYYGGLYRPWYHTGYWHNPGWGGGWYAPHSGYRGRTRTFGNSRVIGTGRGVVGNAGVGRGYGTGIYRSGGARSGGSGTGYRTQGKPSTGQPSSSPRTSTGRRGRDGERIASPPVRQKPSYDSPGRSSSGRDRERSRGTEYRTPQPAPRHERSGGTPSYSPSAPRSSSPSSGGGGSRSGGGGGGGSRGGNRR
jgi:hypothetical protein